VIFRPKSGGAKLALADFIRQRSNMAPVVFARDFCRKITKILNGGKASHSSF